MKAIIALLGLMTISLTSFANPASQAVMICSEGDGQYFTLMVNHDGRAPSIHLNDNKTGKMEWTAGLLREETYAGILKQRQYPSQTWPLTIIAQNNEKRGVRYDISINGPDIALVLTKSNLHRYIYRNCEWVK